MWAIQPSAAAARRDLSSGISPAAFAGLTAWWKAETIAQGDSTAVSSWADSSSSGFTLTQATGANQPTYRTASGPNSRPCVSFDGGDLLTRTSFSGLSLVSSNQCHIFVVQNQTGADAQNTTLHWQSAVANKVNTHLTYDDTCYWDFGNSTAANGRISSAQPAAWDGNWRMVQLIRESPDSGTSRIRVQGSELVNGAVTGTLGAGTATLAIGAQNDGSIGMTGSIAEIIVYNVALSSTNRGLVENYLNARYSLF